MKKLDIFVGCWRCICWVSRYLFNNYSSSKFSASTVVVVPLVVVARGFVLVVFLIHGWFIPGPCNSYFSTTHCLSWMYGICRLLVTGHCNEDFLLPQRSAATLGIRIRIDLKVHVECNSTLCRLQGTADSADERQASNGSGMLQCAALKLNAATEETSSVGSHIQARLRSDSRCLTRMLS